MTDSESPFPRLREGFQMPFDRRLNSCILTEQDELLARGGKAIEDAKAGRRRVVNVRDPILERFSFREQGSSSSQ